VEADIKGFFDNIQWEWLEKMLEQRVNDGALLNLIGKWMRAGILEEDRQVDGRFDFLGFEFYWEPDVKANRGSNDARPPRNIWRPSSV
jgi:hypothetical protein